MKFSYVKNIPLLYYAIFYYYIKLCDWYTAQYFSVTIMWCVSVSLILSQISLSNPVMFITYFYSIMLCIVYTHIIISNMPCIMENCNDTVIIFMSDASHDNLVIVSLSFVYVWCDNITFYGLECGLHFLILVWVI